MTLDLPPIDWFRSPGLDQLTPLTVTDEGRVYGHLAGWDTPHTSFPGRDIRAPRSACDYAYFHCGATQVRDGDDVREISVGRLTMGTGHAGTELSHRAAASWYDDSGAVAALVCVGEDAHGIWFAGSLMSDLDEVSRRRFRACALSGDWRRVGSGLELVAALAVGTPGFPIPRARVASGAPQALVAAGVLRVEVSINEGSFGQRVNAAWAGAGTAAPPVGFDTAAFADAVAAAIERQRRAGELSAAHEALVEELDGTAAVVAALLADVDDSPARAAALLAELDDDVEDFNWVDDVGGLPKYIKRISTHLKRKGMTESHAIATAVNAAKKMCATGDLNFPGSQQVNPGSRAEACAAVADWEAKKARARAS